MKPVEKSLSYMEGKVVAILGFGGLDGLWQARRLQERGIDVIVGLREGTEGGDWEAAGFPVFTVWDAVGRADVIQVW